MSFGFSGGSVAGKLGSFRLLPQPTTACKSSRCLRKESTCASEMAVVRFIIVAVLAMFGGACADTKADGEAFLCVTGQSLSPVSILARVDGNKTAVHFSCFTYAC